jgi:uncharacterized membrane protein YkvA (DUF1232 family)
MSNLPSNETGNSGSRRSRRELATTSTSPGTLRMLYERVILTWKLMWDDRVDLLPKLIPFGAIAYVLSPLDLLPELALGPLGTLDDVGIIMLALTLFIQVVPPDIVQEHLSQLARGRSGAPLLEDDNVIDGEALDE